MKKIILIVSIVVLVAAGGYLLSKNYSDSQNNPPETEASEESHIDYSPATEEDNEQINEEKESIGSKEKEVTKPTENKDESVPNKDSVRPVITFAEDRGTTIAVGSFTEAQENGVCTLTLMQDSAKVTKTTDAVFNVNKYDCPFNVKQSELGRSGVWTALVRFESETESGLSNEQKFEVRI